jgi:hypothetical protein
MVRGAILPVYHRPQPRDFLSAQEAHHKFRVTPVVVITSIVITPIDVTSINFRLTNLVARFYQLPTKMGPD